MTQACTTTGQNLTSRTLDVHSVNDYIRNPMFWSYRGMVGALAQTLDHLMFWSEACACHHAPATSLRSPHTSRRSFFQKRYGVPKCPLAGKRAADFATGRFSKLLHGFLETSLADIALTYTPHLPDADRKLLLDDCAQDSSDTRNLQKKKSRFPRRRTSTYSLGSFLCRLV